MQHNQIKLNYLLCIHVDNFLDDGAKIFINNQIAPIKTTFNIGAEHCGTFKYYDLNINQSSTKIILDKINYIDSLEYINISNDKKKD